MLCLVPLKLYEKYWHQGVAWIEHWNLFQHLNHLVSLPELSHFLAFVLMSILVAGGLLVFTALMIFILEIGLGQESVRAYGKKCAKIIESPLLFVSMGVLIGSLAYVSWWQWHSQVWFFMMVAMLEEYIKFLILRLANQEKFKNMGDILIFAIITALGFAAVENFLYFSRLFAEGLVWNQMTLWVVILRSSVSVLAHVGFSVVLAYFYGKSRYFNPPNQAVSDQSFREKSRHLLHQMLHGKSRILWTEKVRVEGMLIAVLNHMLFNLFLEFGLILPAIFIVLALVSMVLYWLHEYQALSPDSSRNSVNHFSFRF